jgi:RNA polymerase sigma factor (sigma-70 family)
MVMIHTKTLIEALQEQVRSGELDRQFITDKRLQHENNEDLLELRQDFLDQFFRRLSSGRPDDIYCSATYIGRSVKNFITDHFRRRESARNIEQQRLISYRGDARDVIKFIRKRGDRHSARAEQSADEDASINDTHKIILRVTQSMPEKRRRVFELFLDEVPIEAIAAALKISESTVKSHLSVAMQDIVKALQEEGDLGSSKQEAPDDNNT